MLPHQDYRWITGPDGAFLHFRFMCVAIVRPPRAGQRRCEVVIHAKRELRGTASSVEQGMKHVERWIAKNAGFWLRTRRPGAR